VGVLRKKGGQKRSERSKGQVFNLDIQELLKSNTSEDPDGVMLVLTMVHTSAEWINVYQGGTGF